MHKRQLRLGEHQSAVVDEDLVLKLCDCTVNALCNRLLAGNNLSGCIPTGLRNQACAEAALGGLVEKLNRNWRLSFAVLGRKVHAWWIAECWQA